jgi:GNAT superfamily N-acetyltransferase
VMVGTIDSKETAAQFYTGPLTGERWHNLEALFGVRGACGGCWCMYWVLKRSVFDALKGEANKAALRAMVESGEVPGIVGYLDEEPVAWCAIQPRECYPVLERSRILAPVDDQAVWSIVCLFVAKQQRRKGIMVRMLESAAAYAGEQGAAIVEGYPVEPMKPDMPAAFAWTGIASAYRQAGFVEVARRSETRPVMRRMVGVGDQKAEGRRQKAEGRRHRVLTPDP